jgi:hypothetical protein
MPTMAEKKALREQMAAAVLAARDQVPVGPPLTIDLVPKPCWCTNLRTLLTDTEWDAIRKPMVEAAAGRCEVCGVAWTKSPLQSHEIWAYDVDNRAQRLTRLVVLCPDCHNAKHYGRAQQIGYDGEARAQLAKVNGWSAQQVKEHIDQAFAQWDERNKIAWELDVSLLGLPLDGGRMADAKRRAEAERHRASEERAKGR